LIQSEKPDDFQDDHLYAADGCLSELMKAVSHAYVRGRLQTYSG